MAAFWWWWKIRGAYQSTTGTATKTEPFTPVGPSEPIPTYTPKPLNSAPTNSRTLN